MALPTAPKSLGGYCHRMKSMSWWLDRYSPALAWYSSAGSVPRTLRSISVCVGMAKLALRVFVWLWLFAGLYLVITRRAA